MSTNETREDRIKQKPKKERETNVTHIKRMPEKNRKWRRKCRQ